MTLQQLRYVTTVAETGTMSEAARRLFVSQPGLTKAIRELEQEMGIIIFDRTNKGIEVSKDGAIFLGYARQVLEQASLYRFQSRYAGGWHRQKWVYLPKRIHHYQRHRFIIDNRTHHQTMARRIGKTGFGN